ELHHGRFGVAVAALGMQPGSVVREPANAFGVSGHVGQLRLRQLELAETLAELLALLGVAERLIQTCPCQCAAEGAEDDSAEVQSRQSLAQTRTFPPEQVRGRDAAV